MHFLENSALMQSKNKKWRKILLSIENKTFSKSCRFLHSFLFHMTVFYMHLFFNVPFFDCYLHGTCIKNKNQKFVKNFEKTVAI